MNIRLRKILHAALAVSLWWFSLSIYAGEIYKWTDAQGRVHFGDQQQFEAVKPAKSVKVDMPQHQQKQYTAEEINARLKVLEDTRAKIHAELDKPETVLEEPQGIVADLSKINPQCESLAKKVMNTPTGQSFKHLANQMNNLCKGLTYECRQYRKHPKDNECHFTQRVSGQAIVHTVTTD